MPEDWYEGIIKPLHKEGSKEILSNYRGITISCVIYKVLVTIVEQQVMEFVEDKGLLGEHQGAFRKGRRCEDHLFSLKGICSIRKSKKEKTYLAYLDVSKAFDTVCRDTLFKHLWKMGIQGKTWKIIKMLYSKVANTVVFGQLESDLFEVTNGLKQGCVLSPCLFNMVMVNLDDMLNGHGGITIGETTLNGLYYADDIVLFAKSDHELQNMLDISVSFGVKWGLKFNNKKSQVMVIGKRVTDKLWRLGDQVITETKEYKYLGVMINNQVKDSSHISYLNNKVKKLESYLRFTLAKHMDINRVHFGDNLWRKAILPSLSHASAIWFNDSKNSKDNLMSIQYKFAKAILKIYSTPSRTGIIGEFGWIPIIENLNIARISYYKDVLSMSNTRLPNIVYSEMMRLQTPMPFKYVKNITALLNDKGLDCMLDDHDKLSVQTFKDFTWSKYKHEFADGINNSSSLAHYRMVKETTFMPAYMTSLKVPFKGIQLKSKLRLGIGGLGEDLVRQHRGEGRCKNCDEFETLEHFILKCPAYNLPRAVMQEGIVKNVDDETFNMYIQDTRTAIYCLLGDHDNVFNRYFLSYAVQAWKIRSLFIT